MKAKRELQARKKASGKESKQEHKNVSQWENIKQEKHQKNKQERKPAEWKPSSDNASSKNYEELKASRQKIKQARNQERSKKGRRMNAKTKEFKQEATKKVKKQFGKM